MSTFVLNRNYKLRLPTSYVEVDREEMEYVDGGGYVTLTLSTAFQIDVITAGASLAGGLIGNAIGPGIGAIIGGALGWVVGGVIARNMVKGPYTIGGYVPGVSGHWTL